MTPGPAKQFDRDHVLERAMDLFWTSGYEGSSMAALLEHMQVGRQSLYDTFGDKRSLFIEALHHYFRTRIAPVLKILRGPGPAMENLDKATQHWMKEVSSSGFRGCLFGKAIADLDAVSLDEEIQQTVTEFMDAIKAAYLALAQKGQHQGEFTTRLSAEQLAALMVTFTQGAAVMSRVRPEQTLAADGALKELIRSKSN